MSHQYFISLATKLLRRQLTNPFHSGANIIDNEEAKLTRLHDHDGRYVGYIFPFENRCPVFILYHRPELFGALTHVVVVDVHPLGDEIEHEAR